MGRRRKNDTHLPPCVYQKHGAFYHVKRGRWTVLGKTLPEALEAYARLFEQPTGAIERLIDEAWSVIQKSRKEPLSTNTCNAYERAARKLKKALRQFRPEQVMPKHVAAIKRSMSVKTAAFNHLLAFGRQVFDYALEEQLIERNPFVEVKRYPQSKRMRLIEWAEWWKIRSAAAPRLQCVMDGLYLTDQRIGDVLGIDERDALEQGIYFKQQKTGKELIVRWNDDLRAWWARCKALHGKVVRVAFDDPKRARPLFKSRYGRKPAYRTVYDQWVAACAAAEVEDCTLHDNRAFSATEAQRQGKDPQKLLGHQDPRTTKIYLRGREIDVVDGPSLIKTA